MSATKPVVTVNGLTKRFGDFTAVDRISFEVNPGEIFGFLGPNGSGKTTTIRMMLGLLEPSEGNLEVLGFPVHGSTAEILPKIGYMSQRFSLYNDLTVLQNLQFYGAAYNLNNDELKERVKLAVSMAGLEGKEHAQTKNLSGGWRQRLALSAAFLHQPKVLFLDEPTAGVDPLSRRAFWDLLYDLVAQGITVFVTTHYMDEAEHCHRLAFIQRGRIIAYGSLEDIRGTMMQGQVLELAASDPIHTVKTLRGVQADAALPIQNVELYGALVHVVVRDAKKNKPRIAKILKSEGIEIKHAAFIEPSLEDVFIASMS